MKKIPIEVPEDVFDAIAEEAAREFRAVPQQASYLLLTWTREVHEKRQKANKAPLAALNVRPDGSLHAPSNAAE